MKTYYTFKKTDFFLDKTLLNITRAFKIFIIFMTFSTQANASGNSNNKIKLDTKALINFKAFQNTNHFITTWQTTTNGESITIPTFTGIAYNYTVDWGDGTTTTDITGDATHTYTSAGTYDVSITGVFPWIYFVNTAQENRDKIIDVKQWGTNSWTSMSSAFSGCSNLEISATDAPNLSNVFSLGYMFFEASTFNQPIDHWNVNNVNNMTGMFSNATNFNQPLSSWNVSNVTNMSYMFENARAFNQPLNNWNISNVTNMTKMFRLALVFNQPLNNWDVSNVTRMAGLFSNARAFNQPIDNWDVSKVTSMSSTFFNASAFNYPLDNWNVSNVTFMSNMFAQTAVFNQPLNNWNVSNVTQMGAMFRAAGSFNQPLNNWDVSNVTSMASMFRSALNFNQSLGSWNINSVTEMELMFNITNLSIENYDTTLQGWAALPSVQNDVTLGANVTNYCNSEASRDFLINTYNWTINDAGLSCATLSIDNVSLLKLSLYPNPATHTIGITNLNTIEDYEIYNVLGKKVTSGKLSSDASIRVSDLENGVYFLKLEHYKTLRFIKN